MVTGKDSEKPETEETPDQFVIRLKNYLAKWLELSGSSLQNFDALVDLIVKKQFINACSEDLAMYLLERGPKDLVELTTWAQKYLIAHKEQLGKSKATVQPRRADQKKTIQSKPDSSQGRQICDMCQRTVKRGSVRKVPLGSMPLIDTPFKRVAVDIVGPIAPRVRQDIGTS